MRFALQLSAARSARLSQFNIVAVSQRFYATKLFTQDHEWVSLDEKSGVGTVGITEYAQNALGDVVYVELPAKGKKFAKKDVFGAVESVKAASDIYSPVSGEVVETNSELESQPNLINSSPEADGWLMKIKLSDPKEVAQLLDDKAYKAHCASVGSSS